MNSHTEPKSCYVPDSESGFMAHKYILTKINKCLSIGVIKETRLRVFKSLKMAKTTTGSNGLINPIHPNPLQLVEPQPARSGYEPKRSNNIY